MSSGTVRFQGFMPASHLPKIPFCHNVAHTAFFGRFDSYSLLSCIICLFICFFQGGVIDGVIKFVFS